MRREGRREEYSTHICVRSHVLFPRAHTEQVGVSIPVSSVEEQVDIANALYERGLLMVKE